MMRSLKTMFSRALVLLGMTLSLALGQNTPPPAPPAPITFGLIADAQYGNCKPNNTRYYRNSLAKLDESVRRFNEAGVAFTINLGDLADRDFNDLKPALKRLAALKAPIYHTTGNHDYKGVSDNKALFRALGMPAEYYSFTKGKWRFIMLNTNEVAPYSNCTGTPKEQELAAMKQRIAESKRKNGQNWNGGISAAQMQWLAGELEAVRKNGENVLVFTHHPLYPDGDFTALNDREILDILTRSPNVKAVISGHHHKGAYGEYKGIPCITIEGMIETEKTNSYAIVTIKEREIDIAGSGRATSRKIPLP